MERERLPVDGLELPEPRAEGSAGADEEDEEELDEEEGA